MGPGIDGLNAHYHLFQGFFAHIGVFTWKSDLEFYMIDFSQSGGPKDYELYGFTNIELRGGPQPPFFFPDRVDFRLTGCPGRGLSLELRPDLLCNLSGFLLQSHNSNDPSPPFGFVTIDSLAVPEPSTLILLGFGLATMVGTVAWRKGRGTRLVR